MKSVIQEASSVFKAIEQGWEKAGKPREFTVKILQEGHRNFLGMSTANAKVALFFGEPYTPQSSQGQRPQQQDYRPRQQQPHQGGYHNRRPRRRPQSSQGPRPQQQQGQSSYTRPTENRPQQNQNQSQQQPNKPQQ